MKQTTGRPGRLFTLLREGHPVLCPAAAAAGSFAVLAGLCLGVWVTRPELRPPEETAVSVSGTLTLPGAQTAAGEELSSPGETGAPAAPAGDREVVLTVEVEGKEVSVTLEDYLWGVVAAEMPASFEPEALRAQAVAARTYTLYKMNHGGGEHTAQLCDDAGCCQAYISREERMALWGERGEEYAAKITDAVSATDGVVACWEGEAILAVFHAASGPVTRSAGEVWGGEVAYLASVPSPEGEEVPDFYSVTSCTAEEFSAAVGEAFPECDFSSAPETWVEGVTRDPSGLPAGVILGGVEVPVEALRRLFSLRSANLTVTAGAEGVTLSCTGYGHGVGLSQYGANAMAREGHSYQEIISWYYSGVTLENIADNPEILG